MRLLVLFTLLLSGCSPPESERTRGGGPGADLGNRRDDLVLHEKKDPFRSTPRRLGAPPSAAPSAAPASGR